MTIPILAISFIISFIGTYIVRSIALKKSIMDIPNSRSSHTIPTPRGAGIAVSVIWFMVITYVYLTGKLDSLLYHTLLCGIPIFIIGIIDDIYTISPKIRLSIQFVSVSFAVYLIGGIQTVNIGFANISIPLLTDILAVIGIVWFTNLFNFLDGIDGYVGSEVIFICIASFIFTGVTLPLILAAIILGFLLWNWQPAKIFMGDSGSTLVGYTIGIFAIYYSKNTDTPIITWLMLSSVFWFDATLTVLRRLKNKEVLSIAHKKHAYQRIVQYGFSHQKTVIFSLIINILIMGLTWLAFLFPFFSFPLFIIVVVFLYIIVRKIDKRFPFSY